MLTAVFIGEVMPVVIAILGGVFGEYGHKEPIIKSWPDFGLIWVIYSVFGLLFWLLYRYISWKVVAGVVYALSFVLETYVYWHPEGEIGTHNKISFATIFQWLIVYFLVLILPYLVFQKIRHKWGRHGIIISLIVLLLLSALGLGFTYYTMVKKNLWPWRPITNQQNDRSENEEKTYIDLKMVTPYVNESNIGRVGPYSNTENNPWGSKHLGLDFFPTSDLVSFRAVTDGIIEKLDSSKTSSWRTELCINHDPFLVCYSFETFSTNDAVGQKQSENIFVKNGDEVKPGDIIGKLVASNDSAHVDLGILQLGKSGERICPEPYFTKEVKASILRLIHKDYPDRAMCYG